MPTYPLLDTIHSPADLRRLSANDLPVLAAELRDFLIASVAQTGGHFSSNLGTVELTVALHYVFNTPEDRLVWDVGHQTYAHKILTGRRQGMAKLRQWQGISGFPRRSESVYDTFGVAHSSTSISAALGMAIAHQKAGSERKTVAIIGDGAMSAGMAFEALNNAGVLDTDLLVILNDNDMSISEPVGAFNHHLARILSSRFYNSVRRGSEKILSKAKPLYELAKKAEEHVKGMFMPGTLFEEFGFNYIGPIDGHDLETLVHTLQNVKALRGPQFLHVITKKGHGYPLAEQDPILYHGVGKFDPEVGIAPKKSNKPTYTEIFGEWLCDMAAQDERLIGITPAMREGSGLVAFSQAFPDRYFDVGIAEQHAVTFAAGLACEGLKPVVAIYSTFLQRAYDQLIHDVALQNLSVLFAVDRAGLVGPDGATHAGSFDLSYLRTIPNVMIMAPADENECRQMLYTGFLQEQPVVVRYPRGSGPGVSIQKNFTALPIGKAEVKKQGKKIAILAWGSMVQPALHAGEALDATVVNMRFIKPLDTALLRQLTHSHQAIVTVEENAIAGGAGAAVAEFFSEEGVVLPLLHLGLPDQFIDQGEREFLLSSCGLDAQRIEEKIRQKFGRLLQLFSNSSPKLA